MNDIDELMSRDPLSLSAQDIDDIISYHRRGRTQPKEVRIEQSAQDIKAILKLMPKPQAVDFKKKF